MVICSYCNKLASIRRYGKYLCEYHNAAYTSGSFDLDTTRQYDTPTALPNVLVLQDGRVVVDWEPVRKVA